MNDTTESTDRPPWSAIAWAAIEAAYDSVLITDAQLDPPGPRILYANPAFCRMTGYARDEILGETPRILQGPDTDPEVVERLRQDLKAGRPFEGRTTNYRKDGTPFQIEWTIAPVRDDRDRVTHYIAVQRDVTERHRLFQMLSREAVVDPLTETFNRRHGERVLDTEIARARRHGQPVALVMLDIDHFKAVNDRFGHATGDKILRRVADILRTRMRATDTLCRWGGEEFLIVLANTNLDGAQTFAEDLRSRIAEARYAAGLSITVSLGVAAYAPCEDRDTWIERADQALYAAKTGGRNRVAAEVVNG